MKNLFLIFIFLSTSLCCTENSNTGAQIIPQEEQEVSSISANGSTSALFFKKEKKIEIWSDENPKQLLKTLKSIELSAPEVGLYTTSIDSIPTISNYISKQSIFSPSKIMILPNDPRPTGRFQACFACSFEKASIYAKLEMLLNEYSTLQDN